MLIQTFKTEEAWIKAATDFIVSQSPQTIALSGGSTPAPIYQKLGKTLQNSQYYQVDERYVPHSDPESNYKMIQETLGLACKHFDTSLTIDEALSKYAQELPTQFDVCILGIGPDGHIASIFPNTSNNDAPVLHSTTDQFAIHDRLSLSLKTILNSKTIIVLLKNKDAIIKELQNPTKTPEEFPALKLLTHNNLHIFSKALLTN